MPGPFEALQKAQTIGAPPGRLTLPSVEDDVALDQPEEWLTGAAPGPIAGLRGALTNLKPDGPLYQTLERAALKSGMGQAGTPGETQLLKQFMDPILGRAPAPAAPAPLPIPAQSKAGWAPWQGLMNLVNREW